MIFFESDWAKYPHAVLHETRNLSFRRMSIVLAKLGVKNNKFMLALSQPDLAKYDPHHLKDNSLELRMRIAWECSVNPWYYFREVARISDHGSPEPIPYRLDRGNLAFTWLILLNIHVFIMQSRQSGKSVGVLEIVNKDIHVSASNAEFGLLANTMKLVNEHIDRIRQMRDALPSFLINSTNDDTDNKQELSYAAHHTRIRTFVARSTESAAIAMGRGLSPTRLFIDEIGYCTNIHLMFPSLKAAQSKAVERARLNNQPHSNIYATTAPRIDTKEGNFIFTNIVQGALPFSVKLYDTDNRDDLVDMVQKNSTNNIVNCVHSYLQLGYTHEWLKAQAKESGATEDEIDRDYRNILKAGVQNSALPIDVIQVINQNRQEDPNYIERVGQFLVNWYINKDALNNPLFTNRSLIMGMDGAVNVGRDFTAFVIVDATDMSVVATMRCNDANIIRVGFFVITMLLRFPNMLFAPETNSTGMSIIDQVIEYLIPQRINPFQRIFNRVIQNRRTEASLRDIDIREAAGANDARKYFGFHTNTKTREFLYDQVLSKAIELNKDRLKDPTLISELSTLTSINGRVDHPKDGHDDLTIAYLLCCFVVYFGRDLENYSLVKEEILSRVDSSGNGFRQGHVKEQKDLHRQIETVQNMIKEEPEGPTKEHYRIMLTRLRKEIDTNVVIEPVGRDQTSDNLSLIAQSMGVQENTKSNNNISRFLSLIG